MSVLVIESEYTADTHVYLRNVGLSDHHLLSQKDFGRGDLHAVRCKTRVR